MQKNRSSVFFFTLYISTVVSATDVHYSVGRRCRPTPDGGQEDADRSGRREPISVEIRTDGRRLQCKVK